MEATKINETEVKKELMRSKVNAKLSHYVSGNIYYTVELADGTYQFPISTIETGTLDKIFGPCQTKDLDNEGFIGLDGLYTLEEVKKYYDRKKIAEDRGDIFIDDMLIELQVSKLSEDLGTTTFSNEMRGSELNRWISKAIKNDEFIKIN